MGLYDYLNYWMQRGEAPPTNPYGGFGDSGEEGSWVDQTAAQYQESQGGNQGSAAGSDDLDPFTSNPVGTAAYDSMVNYAKGNPMGSAIHSNPRMDETSAMRGDQTKGERTAHQEANYTYGNYEGAAQDAINTARTNLAPYTGQLSSMGSGFYNTGMAAGGREAPIDEYNLGQHGYGTGNMFNTADMMLDAANRGPGASYAQAMHDANTAQAMRQQLALAGSGRGAGGGAAAFRQAQANQAQIQGAANAQTGALQAQEDQMWRQHQANLLGQAGALYGSGAETALSGAQYTTGAHQAQTNMNDAFTVGMGNLANDSIYNAGQLATGAEQLAHQINMGNLTGNMAYEDNLTAIYNINEGGKQPNGGMDPYVAAGLETAGNVLPIIADGTDDDKKSSDIRAKKNIEPASALDAVSGADGYTYNYLDPERHGDGTYLGPMAQDLEGAPGVVKEDKNGTKQIDTSRLSLLNTSALAELNEKVDNAIADKKGAPKKSKWDVSIGDAQVESPGYDVEFGEAQIESPHYDLVFEPAEFPQQAATLGSGPTQPTEYSGDPVRLQQEAMRYGTPVYGAPPPEAAASEAGPSYFDRFLGPNLGQHASDVTEEEYQNELLRQYFRRPPRQDIGL